MKINHGGREWPYQQLVQQIRERIESGEYLPGRMIPSLQQVVEETGVSLKTVQRAYRQLEAEGLVEIVPGRGTFVREP